MPDVMRVPKDVSVREWVNLARSDPVRYRERQATEILLTAIGLVSSLRDTLYLKGGALMALGFRSTRVTADVDFTAEADPDDLPERIADELNGGLTAAAANLGYVDFICRVQRITRRPRPQNFAQHEFPALEMTVGYAKRGSKGEEYLLRGACPDVIKIEISFKEQVMAFDELHLTDAEVEIRAYSITEIIAEKYRALLQQPHPVNPARAKARRQDVYDIAYLLEQVDITDQQKREILDAHVEKCRTRNITPTSSSLEDPRIKSLSAKNWHTLITEIGEIPDFESRYELVANFYKNLPW